MHKDINNHFNKGDFLDNPIGSEIYNLAEKLFPICRSLTGDGVRQTLNIMREECPSLTLFEVPTGTAAFDWVVPKEWEIRDAYIKDLEGSTVLSFKDSNLHVVGYSAPFNRELSREELLKMIHTLPDKPTLIPYVTSYYKEYSGFCMAFNDVQNLNKDRYRAVIESELKDGSLTYGEILIPGKSEKEIFFSSNICHPTLANNELSGPCLSLYLAKRAIAQSRSSRYSYRFIFIPETIGSLVYMSRNLEKMKENIIAGFVVTCAGDNRSYSYLSSRRGDTLADRAAKNTLNFTHQDYKSYPYLERGSDERQYCAPGIDLPVCSLMRSKYGEYPEYHTSADNMELISPEGFEGSYALYCKVIDSLENNRTYKAVFLGEPQLGKRDLYPTVSYSGSAAGVRDMMNLLAYADGEVDLIGISDIIKVPMDELSRLAIKLESAGLLERK
jgi:aminopeptidase-like protein